MHQTEQYIVKSNNEKFYGFSNHKNEPYGTISNAMNTAQTFIHGIQKVCKAIQITGKLRLLDMDGYETLELVAATKLYKNVIGEQIADLEHSQIHQFLNANPKIFKDLHYEYGKYYFIYKKYHFILHHVWNINEMTVAQIHNTGPSNFNVWLQNNLPWGWTIADYQLRDNTHKLVKNIINENAFFTAIGYRYILPIVRVNETSDYWSGFKI